MSEPAMKIYLVDDEPSVRKALSRLLQSAGLEVAAFASAREFMAQSPAGRRGCLVLDVAMPEFTGLELQKWLSQTDSVLPVIFLTGRADIAMSVQAMKGGAVDFLTKPVNDAVLLAAVQEALRREQAAWQERGQRASIQSRLDTLTPRERQVLEHVVTGQLNKQIAHDLGTAEKTIKVHRARVMKKMGVTSLAELVRLAERAGLGRDKNT